MIILIVQLVCFDTIIWRGCKYSHRKYFFGKLYKSITYYIRNSSGVVLHVMSQGKLFRQNRASNLIPNKKENFIRISTLAGRWALSSGNTYIVHVVVMEPQIFVIHYFSFSCSSALRFSACVCSWNESLSLEPTHNEYYIWLSHVRRRGVRLCAARIQSHNRTEFCRDLRFQQGKRILSIFNGIARGTTTFREHEFVLCKNFAHKLVSKR